MPSSRSPASDEEIRIANRLMDMVDSGKASTFSLDSAAAILTQRGLSLHQLYKIWSLADRSNKGYLTSSELTVAIRLIGWAQAGHEIVEGLVKTCQSNLFLCGHQAYLTAAGPSPMLRGITDLVSRKLPDPGILPLMRRVSMTAQKPQNIEKVFDFIHNEKFRNVFVQEKPIHGVVCRQ